MLNRPSKAAIVSVALVIALFAAMAVSLWLLLPGGPIQAQAATINISYDEKGTGPVFTFASRDPEGVVPPTIWSLVEAIQSEIPGATEEGCGHWRHNGLR